MVYLCSTASRSHRHTVYFLVCLEWITGKFYSYVADDARIVCIVITSVYGTRSAFYLHSALVVFGFATDNESTPIAWFTVACCLCRSENDRRGSCSLGDKLATGLYNKRCFCIFISLYDGA